MEDRILLIDDDHHLLSAMRRQLMGEFDLTTAQGGEEGIAEVQAGKDKRNPFAVVVCDMRMPGMDGVETLRRINEISPETVRIMLTGNADQQTAIDAINEGNIFRFYTKPCETAVLSKGLKAAIEQYRLVMSERELLEKTLTGSLKLLFDVLSMNDPAAAATATRLRDYVRRLTVEFQLPQRWQLEAAASLAPIGQIAVPPEVLAKKRSGEPLSVNEQAVIDRSPEVARNLIANIPRLSKVAEIVYLQDRGYDGSGFPSDGPKGADIPFDARMLKLLKDLAEVTGGTGSPNAAAFFKLEQKAAQYDPKLFAKVRATLESTAPAEAPTEVDVPVAALRPGLLVISDVRLTNGHLILPAFTQLTAPQIERLRNLQKIFTFVEPIKVKIGAAS